MVEKKKEKMELLKEICNNYELNQKLVGSNESKDDDILNCPLGFNLSFNPETGRADIDLYKSKEDKITTKILQNFNPGKIFEKPESKKQGGQRVFNFDSSLPKGFFMSESEEAQLYKQLKFQTQQEDMLNSDTRELTKLRDEFFREKIDTHEKKNLLRSLVQNDGSSSYKVDLLTGKVVSSKLGFLPENSKKSNNTKEDTKIANFKRELVFKEKMKLTDEELDARLLSLGGYYQAHMEENLEQGGDYIELAEDNLLRDNYDEINKASILPTSKRETRYLLGLDEENQAENLIENLLKDVVGERKKKDFDGYTRERRKQAGRGSKKKSGKEGYGASLENLMKAYEENTGRKIVKAGNKKLGQRMKKNLDYVNKKIVIFSEIRCRG